MPAARDQAVFQSVAMARIDSGGESCLSHPSKVFIVTDMRSAPSAHEFCDIYPAYMFPDMQLLRSVRQNYLGTSLAKRNRRVIIRRRDFPHFLPFQRVMKSST
jgi:hypothetical protein